MSALNTVPVMVHPLSMHWVQPPLDRILIDDEHALMDKADFERLAEYSATNPSGAYVGKMWRRHEVKKGSDLWYLGWYGHSEKPGFVSNNWRLILIA